MEIDLDPPLDHDAPGDWENFEELSARSLRISLHEVLARQWEASQLVPADLRGAAWSGRVEQLGRMYKRDIGRAPSERHALEAQIEAAIASGSLRTLASILELFGDQARNGSSLSVA